MRRESRARGELRTRCTTAGAAALLLEAPETAPFASAADGAAPATAPATAPAARGAVSGAAPEAARGTVRESKLGQRRSVLESSSESSRSSHLWGKEAARGRRGEHLHAGVLGRGHQRSSHRL
jgi:hypothetical protein